MNVAIIILGVIYTLNVAFNWVPMGEILGYLSGENIQARKKIFLSQKPKSNSIEFWIGEIPLFAYVCFKLHEKMTYPYFIKFFIN